MTRAEQLEQMNQEAVAAGFDRWVPVFTDLMRTIDALYDRVDAEANGSDLLDVLAGALAAAAEAIGERMGPCVGPTAVRLLRYQQDTQAVRDKRQAEEDEAAAEWANDEDA